jgi:hypothetical protein
MLAARLVAQVPTTLMCVFALRARGHAHGARRSGAVLAQGKRRGADAHHIHGRLPCLLSFVVTDLEISPEARALVDSIADGLAAVLAYRRERAARDATAADRDSSAVEQLNQAA